MVDNRKDEKRKLHPLLEDIAALGRLEFGDISFESHDGKKIGLERKTLRDLLSSMTTGRLLGHQVPGLLNMYDVTYLIVEGVWKASPKSAALLTRCGKKWIPIRFGKRFYTHREFYSFLNSLEILFGIHCITTYSIVQTACVVRALHHWWNKPEHHTEIGAKPMLDISKYNTVLFRWAYCLPGVGKKKAKAVSEYFTSPVDLATAQEKVFEEVPGIGKNLARSIYKSIHEGDGDASSKTKNP